jgi:hypothetical protein
MYWFMGRKWIPRAAEGAQHTVSRVMDFARSVDVDSVLEPCT